MPSPWYFVGSRPSCRRMNRKAPFGIWPYFARHCSGVPVHPFCNANRHQALLPARFRFSPASAIAFSTNDWQSMVLYGTPRYLGAARTISVALIISLHRASPPSALFLHGFYCSASPFLTNFYGCPSTPTPTGCPGRPRSPPYRRAGVPCQVC